MGGRTGINRRDFLRNATVAAALLAGPAGSGSWVAHAQTSADPASDQTMLTLLYYATVKEGNEQKAQEPFARVAATTPVEDDGCIAYVVYQQQDDPMEYVLFEQWRDQAALDAHIAHLQAVFGPPPSDEIVPATILDLFAKARGVLYRVAA